jgi:hypothetical protein
MKFVCSLFASPCFGGAKGYSSIVILRKNVPPFVARDVEVEVGAIRLGSLCVGHSYALDGLA